MRKRVWIALLMALMMVLCPRAVFVPGLMETVAAAETDWSAADFVIESGVVTGLSESGTAKAAVNPAMVIPEKDADGNAVTEIGQIAFRAITDITSVVIPDSITKMGSGAFTNCTNLESVTLSKSLTEIPQAAFTTNNLKSVVIPEGVISIGNNAFTGNFGLTELVLPSTLETIGNSAFGNHQMKSLEIPASVKSIGNYAFRINNNTLENSLETLILHEGLESIGNAAFGRSSLTKVDLPSTVTTLNKNAFKDSTNVVDVYTDNADLVASDNPTAQLNIILSPRTITFDALVCDVDPATAETDTKGKLESLPTPEFGNYEFLGWFTTKDGGTEITENTVYKESATIYAHWNIGDWSAADFQIEGGEVKGLSESGVPKAKVKPDMIIPGTDGEGNPVTSISTMAFKDNKDITSVVIPDSVIAMGAAAFQGTTSLKEVTLSKGLTAIPQAAFSVAELSKIQAVTIPNGVTNIGRSSFSGRMIETLSLPESVETIEREAFYNHQLKSIELPANVKTVDQGAFRVNNPKLEKTLESLTLNEGLTTIGRNTFGGSNLASIDLPASVVTLEKTAFSGSVNTVDVHTDNSALLASDNPTAQLNIVLNPRTVTFETEYGEAPAAAQTGAKGKLAELPAAEFGGFDFLGWFAAADGEDQITAETVFEKDTAVYAHWAAGDWKAADFVIESGAVKGLSESGTAKAKLVPAMVIPEKDADGNAVTEIGQTAFSNNKDITSVVIPDSITTMGNGAFTACSNLEAVTLSKSLTEIPQAAFNTNDLKSVVIPEGVISIGNNAFTGNFGLTELVLPSTLETIGNSAFGNHQMKSLEIPASVKSIGNYAFRINNNTLENSLETLILHEGLESIGNAAFGRSSLTKVDLPSTVTTLHKNAFKDSTGVVDVYTDNADLMASDNPTAQLNIVLNPRTVTFVTEYGEAPAAAQTGAKGKLEELPTPSFGELQFQGWFTAAEGGDEITLDRFYKESETVYAQWKSAEAEAVAEKINLLNDPAGVEDEQAVEEARAAYDALTEAQKKFVDAETLAKLQAAEEQVAAAKDQAAADEVAKKINELPDPLPDEMTAEIEEAVAAAKEAYDALTEEQKAKVDPAAVEKLKAAEAAVVKAKIEALPENAGTADEAAVEAAQKAYDALTDEQKAALGDDVKNKLETAAKQVSDAKAAEQKAGEDAKTAEGVASKISALPAADKVTLADKSKVEEAAKAYDALTEDQKKAVPADVVKKLEDAKNAIAALEKEEQDEEAAGHETLAAFDSKVTSASSEDPAGTEFGKVQAKIAKKVGKNNLKVQWKAVSGASGYVIYANKAGKKNKYVKIAEVKGKTSYTLKKIKSKKLAKNTYYKVLVAAVKTTKGGTARVIAKAKPVYAATNGGKNGNPTKLTVNKSKVPVKVKKSFKLKVKQSKPSSKKIVKKRAVKYESSNKSIATVSAKGVIKGKKAGKCKIYVYAQNGLVKTVTVTVKK